MDKKTFQSLVREYLKEYSSPKETVKKSELKTVIKECLRVILNEVDWHDEYSYMRSHGDDHSEPDVPSSPPKKKMTGPYHVYSKRTGKHYLATKDEATGVYYYLHPDTGTDVPLGTESPELQVQKSKIKEMTTTGAVTPLNLPTWVSRRGGSERGIAGSAALGYELTPIGKKDMNRKQDPI